MNYPKAVCGSLRTAREDGCPFTLAWKRALDANPTPDEWTSILPFMRKHMEAAYNGEDSMAGRLRVEEPETSEAVPSGRAVMRVAVTGKCRSGDKCSSDANHGLFCEVHSAELARVRRECFASEGSFGAGRDVRSAA